MSAEEQDAAILRLLKERAEAKRERTLIEIEIARSEKALYDASFALHHQSPIDITREQLQRVTQLLEQVNTQELAERLRQHAELSARIRQYDQTARELGID